jgi:hypothetical protein
MSFRAKRELLIQVTPRYCAAVGKAKTAILDQFVAATGYDRKYAIRLLNQPVPVAAKEIKRPRQRRYGREVQEALIVAWTAANCICTKRLLPFLPALVESLERHGHLALTDEVRRQLLALSPATADRILSALRQREKPHGLTTTKPGALLKHQVPVRTFADWNEVRAGFFEVDVVAHCGTSMEGVFLSSLVLTDVATGWTECLALRQRSQEAVIAALEQVRQLLPFAMLGVDTDNGGEFLNYELLTYCEREQITFTRGRAYKKNDQCFVEQKNGSIVRQLVGYDRYTGEAAYRQLAELYRAARLYVNFFQPSMKLTAKQRDGSHTHRKYDAAQTPVQRLIAARVLTEAKRQAIQHTLDALDPVRLLQQVRTLQDAFWRHAVDLSSRPASSSNGMPVNFDLQMCVPAEQNATDSDPLPLTGDEVKQRKYHRTKKPTGPRTWRTRQDPFAAVDAELHQWFLNEPGTTAKALLQQLQQSYPGQFADGQVRTLQRRVNHWRSQMILEFDDHLLADGTSLTGNPLTHLRAVPDVTAHLES